MSEDCNDFTSVPKINEDFTVTVPGKGRLGAAQVMHAVRKGGRVLALEMKAAVASKQREYLESVGYNFDARPWERRM